MSRATCSNCGTVVSTTADPNSYEGWFVNLEHAEQLEVELQNDRGQSYSIHRLLNKVCKRIVLCDACQSELLE